jgi:DNA-binding CsgD family transcriptional regulator
MEGSIDRSRIRDLIGELDTIRLSGQPFAKIVVPAIREALGLAIVALYSLALTDTAWNLTQWNQDGLPSRVETLFRQVLENTNTSPGPALFYDPRFVPPRERNRVIEARSWVERRHGQGSWARSAMCTDMFLPLGIERHDQLRALVCEGPALLGWFGGLHPEPVTPRQRRMLAALVPAMQRRLALERRLARATVDQKALEAALEHLGTPAFVVDDIGRIEQTNAVGALLLAERAGDVRAALGDALADRANDVLRFKLTRLTVPGARAHWLAVLEVSSVEDRIASCLRLSVARWQLTPRQAEVLALVARGHANATIATLLGTGDRAIELHLTALFDRVGVDSRAALISRVLTMSG